MDKLPTLLYCQFGLIFSCFNSPRFQRCLLSVFILPHRFSGCFRTIIFWARRPMTFTQNQVSDTSCKSALQTLLDILKPCTCLTVSSAKGNKTIQNINEPLLRLTLLLFEIFILLSVNAAMMSGAKLVWFGHQKEFRSGMFRCVLAALFGLVFEGQLESLCQLKMLFSTIWGIFSNGYILWSWLQLLIFSTPYWTAKTSASRSLEMVTHLLAIDLLQLFDSLSISHAHCTLTVTHTGWICILFCIAFLQWVHLNRNFLN